MDCPRCGKEGSKTGKTWKFGLFDVEGYKCTSCQKSFNAYYRDGNFSHTVPKPK